MVLGNYTEAYSILLEAETNFEGLDMEGGDINNYAYLMLHR
jgi:hypothetical protein